MQSTPSLLSLAGPLWSGVVAPDRILLLGQIELSVVLSQTELFELELFICIKMGLALNNLQWLIYRKTKPKKTKKKTNRPD